MHLVILQNICLKCFMSIYKNNFLKGLAYNSEEKRYGVSLPWKLEYQADLNDTCTCKPSYRQLHKPL